MATFIIFGDAADAGVGGISTVFADARETGTEVPAPTATSVSVEHAFVAPNYRCRQALFAFDTSTLTGTVTSATFSLFPFTRVTGADGGFTLEARLHDWGATAETADFVAGSALSGKTLLASYNAPDNASWTGTGYVNFVSEADFLTNIDPAFTRMVVASDKQRLATVPTATTGRDPRTADQVGTTNDPKLTIVTDTPDPFPQSRVALLALL